MPTPLPLLWLLLYYIGLVSIPPDVVSRDSLEPLMIYNSNLGKRMHQITVAQLTVMVSRHQWSKHKHISRILQS